MDEWTEAFLHVAQQQAGLVGMEFPDVSHYLRSRRHGSGVGGEKKQKCEREEFTATEERSSHEPGKMVIGERQADRR